MFSGNTSDFFDWLNRTDLVVCKHNRNQNCLRCDRFLQFIKTDNTILIYIEIGDLCSSFLLKIFTGVQDCMMLDLGCDDMISFGFICFKGCLECPVVSLASACCKVDFFFFGIQDIRYLLSSSCHCLFALLSKIINTGRVSIVLGKVRKHCLKNFRCSFGCCRIIQIY